MDASTEERGSASTLPGLPRRIGSGWVGLVVIALIGLPCLLTLPWSLSRYEKRSAEPALSPPSLAEPMGTDLLGRSMLWRCMLGGAISLGIGLSAAGIAVGIGVAWGAAAGYAGGNTDAGMMRIVDVLYGLPYILLVVLINIALKPAFMWLFIRIAPEGDAAAFAADLTTLLVAIGGVSWLTMSRVIRGQVLSLRAQPFIEAARACGLHPVRIFVVHLLPNLVGPIVVYTTLTVPTAILQESFLSFLGIGVQPPLPSWGGLARDGLSELHSLSQPNADVKWWLIVWPCVMLGLTLLALNFLGDALRRRLDPRKVR